MAILKTDRDIICKSAYSLLYKCKIKELPTDLFEIISLLNIRLIENKEVNELKLGECGLSIYDGCSWHIVYDSNMNIGRIRFTIAHELGHIVLNHRDKSSTETELESKADLFASRLLAPPCILKKLNAYSASSIGLICNVSRACAEIQSKTMIDMYLNKTENKNQLEKDLVANFEDFIANNRLINPFAGLDLSQNASKIYEQLNKGIRKKPSLNID